MLTRHIAPRPSRGKQKCQHLAITKLTMPWMRKDVIQVWYCGSSPVLLVRLVPSPPYLVVCGCLRGRSLYRVLSQGVEWVEKWRATIGQLAHLTEDNFSVDCWPVSYLKILHFGRRVPRRGAGLHESMNLSPSEASFFFFSFIFVGIDCKQYDTKHDVEISLRFVSSSLIFSTL